MEPIISQDNIRSTSCEVISQSAKPSGTMRWVILPILWALAEAGKFDRGYLPPPPPNAKDAGGHEDDLQLPLEPPYIDPYSDNRHLVPTDGGTRGLCTLTKDSRGTWDKTKNGNFPDGSQTRLLYGSYTYMGADDVLVTVTYPVDKNKPKSGRKYNDDKNDRRLFDWYDPGEKGIGVGSVENGVVATPPNLPRQFDKAYAFDKNKFQQDDKKDERKDEKGVENNISRQPWTQQPTRKPIIYQGYSHPKTIYQKN